MHLYRNKQLTMTIVLKQETIDVQPDQALHVLMRYDKVMTSGTPQVNLIALSVIFCARCVSGNMWVS